MLSEKNRFLAFILLALIVLILYANILPNPFVWDDNVFIVQNQFIRDWRNIPLLFQSEFFSRFPKERPFEKGGYYRPLVMLLYTVEYPLWGESPMGYHLVSILLHIGNVFLVYVLFQALFRNTIVPFLGALLFACHPIHTEAVSYLPSRGDLLAAFFCLASFLSTLSSKWRLRWASLFFFALALLSKESAMIFPGLLLVYPFCQSIRRFRKEWLIPSLHVLILLFYACLRLLFFPFRLRPWLVEDPGFFIRFLSAGKLILSYLSLLIFPYPLHLERSAPFQRTFWEMGTLAFFAVFGGVLWLGILLWRKNRSAFFGMCWFLIGLVPVSNLIPLSPSMAEHYLYFPSIGYFGVFSFGLVHLYKWIKTRAIRKVLLSIGTFLLTFYAVSVPFRNRDYSDEVRLFVHTLTYSPESPLIHNNLGAILISRGYLEEAKREFERSLALNPNQPHTWSNLGTLYKQKREYEKAVQCFKKALEKEKEDPVLWNRLGITYAEKGSDDAVAAFLEAIRLKPTFVQGYFNLGSYYWEKGAFQKAASFWEEAQKIDPDNPELKRWYPLLKEKISEGR